MFLIFSLIFSEWIDIVIPGTDMIIEVEEQMIVVEEEVIAGNAQEVIIGWEETVWVGETVAQERTAGVTFVWG